MYKKKKLAKKKHRKNKIRLKAIKLDYLSKVKPKKKIYKKNKNVYWLFQFRCLNTDY